MSAMKDEGNISAGEHVGETGLLGETDQPRRLLKGEGRRKKQEKEGEWVWAFCGHK